MSYLSYTKNLGNFMELLLRDHKRYMPIVEFVDNVTQQLYELSWEECELIFIDISKINGSEFCTGIHTGVANALNNTAKPIRNEKLNPLIKLARKFNNNAQNVEENDIQIVKDAGWSDQTIEDVAGLVAIINVYNILANGLGFKALPAEAFDEMGKATIQQGYKTMFNHYINM